MTNSQKAQTIEDINNYIIILKTFTVYKHYIMAEMFGYQGKFFKSKQRLR